jgi:hypothetical protein
MQRILIVQPVSSRWFILNTGHAADLGNACAARPQYKDDGTASETPSRGTHGFPTCTSLTLRQMTGRSCLQDAKFLQTQDIFRC